MKNKKSTPRVEKLRAKNRAKGLSRIELKAYPEDKPTLKAIEKQLIENRERDNEDTD